MSLNGKQCIGCGFCCSKALCSAAVRLYSISKPPCPAFKWNGERHVCDLMTLPGLIGKGYREELYAGEGCCSGLNSWRGEPLQDRTKEKEDPNVDVPPIMQHLLSCLGREFISGDVWFLAFEAFKDKLRDDNYTDSQIQVIVRKCVNLLKNQRPSYVNSFIGPME